MRRLPQGLLEGQEVAFIMEDPAFAHATVDDVIDHIAEVFTQSTGHVRQRGARWGQGQGSNPDPLMVSKDVILTPPNGSLDPSY